MTKANINIVGSDKAKAIARQICDIPRGQFRRWRWTSDVDITAAARKQHITIQKQTITTARTGVKYANIAGVVLKEGNPNRTSNYEWVKGAENYIKYNRKTGRYYAVIAPIAKGHNTKVEYILTDASGKSRFITAEEAKQYTIASYWKKSGDKPAVITVALDNIKDIK